MVKDMVTKFNKNKKIIIHPSGSENFLTLKTKI